MNFNIWNRVLRCTKTQSKKRNKFYDLDLEENAHADELFDVLNEVISFDSAAIFYLTPEKLTLEFGKNYEIYEDIILDEKTSKISRGIPVLLSFVHGSGCIFIFVERQKTLHYTKMLQPLSPCNCYSCRSC